MKLTQQLKQLPKKITRFDLNFECPCGTHFFEECLNTDRLDWECPNCGKKTSFTKATNYDLLLAVILFRSKTGEFAKRPQENTQPQPSHLFS